MLILDLSTTGLLVATSANLTNGETIALNISEAGDVDAVVKWSSGRLFGCQFIEPISTAAVSAALLRAPYELPSASIPLPPAQDGDLADEEASQSSVDGQISLSGKLRWMVGLTLLVWVAFAGIASLAWQYVY